jgi:hypothetical protein
MKTVIETATASELAIIEQLVARLKTSVESNCPPVDSRGDRLFGVTLKGNDRTDLVKAIAAEAGMSILPLDGEALALGLMPLFKFNDVTWAFGPSRWPQESTSSHVVVYISDFGKIAAPRRSAGTNHHIDEIAASLLSEIENLKRNTTGSIFVIVSSDDEIDAAFTRAGRLLLLEQLRV